MLARQAGDVHVREEEADYVLGAGIIIQFIHNNVMR